VDRTLHDSAVITCLCWAASFVIGSIPLGHLVERLGLRRDLRRLEGGRRGSPDLRALLGGGERLPGVPEIVGAALDTAKVVGLAAATLALVRAGSPFHRGAIPPSSAIGVLAGEVLTAWQSAALWAGLVAGVGHLWPIWLGGLRGGGLRGGGLRGGGVRGGGVRSGGFASGGQAQTPLMAVAIWFCPTAFVVAVAAYLIGRLLPGGARAAVMVSLLGFVAWGWAAWLWDLPHWWGLPWGPELAVWVAVVAGVIAARNLGAATAV
jgi:hypothetical protein